MKTNKWILVGVLLCLFCFGAFLIESLVAQESQQAAPKYPAKDFKEQNAYQVVRVIDGDTIVILVDNKEVKVRLIGVDTPETVHPQKQVEFYGKEASGFLTNLLKGEEVYIESPKDSRDKYGRLLAYLYRAPDGLFVNLEIVRQGYGHAYTKYPFKYMDLFRAYGQRATESEKGLWTPRVEKKEQTEITVYITRTGRKYHRDGCRWLSKSRIPISLKEAKERGYGPCKVCNPPR